MFAGYDTTSNSLTWMAYLLAKHPAAQEKLFEELSSVTAIGIVPTVDTLKGCSYLYAVIKETLRFFTPVLAFSRLARKDDVLPGTKTFIPAGIEVVPTMFVLHRSKDIYGSNSDEFVPERWEDPQIEERVGEAGFMPFSIGKRNCIGKEFAMNEMAMLAAVVFRNFKLEWPADEPEPVKVVTPVMKPKEPFNVLITRRR